MADDFVDAPLPGRISKCRLLARQPRYSRHTPTTLRLERPAGVADCLDPSHVPARLRIEFVGNRPRKPDARLHRVVVRQHFRNGRAGTTFDACDDVAGAKLPFTGDAQVKAAAAAGTEARHHVPLSEADRQLETRLARPGDNELCRTHPKPVAHAHIVFEQTL